MDENGNGQNGNGNGYKPRKKPPIRSTNQDKIDRAAKTYVTNGGNLTKAYIAAGNSPNSANSNAQRLKADERFTAAVKREMARAAKAANVDADSVMGQLARLAFYDPNDFIDPKTGVISYKKMRRAGLTFLIEKIKVIERHSEKGGRVTVEYELPRKLPALEALMRAIGMEKEPAKNPEKTARSVLKDIKKRFPNLPAGEAEKIIERQFGIAVETVEDKGLVG